MEPNLGATGGEDTTFVFVGLRRRHLRERRRIERYALTFGRVDSNGPLRVVKPDVTSRYEKPLLPLARRSAGPGNDDIARAILRAIHDEPIQLTHGPILEVEHVDRGKGTTEPSIEVSRSHVNEAAVP